MYRSKMATNGYKLVYYVTSTGLVRDFHFQSNYGYTKIRYFCANAKSRNSAPSEAMGLNNNSDNTFTKFSVTRSETSDSRLSHSHFKKLRTLKEDTNTSSLHYHSYVITPWGKRLRIKGKYNVILVPRYHTVKE
jgi:hypothetical protein